MSAPEEITPAAATTDTYNDQLLTLLQLEREIRRVENREQLKFLISNDTHRLIPYTQAVFFTFSGFLGVTFESISSLSQIDKNSPFLIWLQKVVQYLQKTGETGQPFTVNPEQLPEELNREWQEWRQGQVLYCPMVTQSGNQIGGLWLNRNDVWPQNEMTLLQRISDSYAYSWQALEPRHSWLSLLRKFLKGKLKWILLALVLISLIPIQQTVLAPAQVAARQPVVISAPIDGVIETIEVKPNEFIEAGTLLFKLEDTNFRNQYQAAVKSLSVAEANYLLTSQKAFADIDSKNELAVLKAILDEKQAEVDYHAELLARIQVRAERDGVVVFGDPNDWLGKPVSVGEKVMTLADIENTWLDIWLAVDDAITLDKGAELQLFLNIDPLNSYSAVIERSSYEAQLSPQDILSYRLKAGFDSEQTLPRLGLKGTAKIYGNEITIFYYIFRRPLAELRRWLGW